MNIHELINLDPKSYLKIQHEQGGVVGAGVAEGEEWGEREEGGRWKNDRF